MLSLSCNRWDAVVLEQPNTFCIENPPLEPLTKTQMPDKMNDRLSLLQGTSLRSSLSHGELSWVSFLFGGGQRKEGLNDIYSVKACAFKAKRY